jgi:hypothetical protein
MQVVAVDGVPITPSGSVAVSPGQTFELEFSLEGWASPTSGSCTVDEDCPLGEECIGTTCIRRLYGYQVALDAASLVSDGAGMLELATFSCSDDGDCFDGAWISSCLDGYCEGNGLRCDTASPVCLDGSACILDPAGDFCDCFASIYSDSARTDYVFYQRGIVSAPDCTSEEAQAGGYKIGASLLSLNGEPDSGAIDYGSTMIFLVPEGACGTFTLMFDPADDATFGRVAFGYALDPLDLASTVTIDAGDCSAAIAGAPLNCEVDARQPTDLNDANIKYGWNEIEIEFTSPPVGLTNLDFNLDEVPPGFLEPTISDFTPTVGNMGVLTLSPRINPAKWTCVWLRSDPTNQVCVGYLPGDADADLTTAPADILAVIDDLNGVIPGEEYQIDMDRDGTKAPADILRVIDLLNGAGQFDSWNGVSLPACPSE